MAEYTAIKLEAFVRQRTPPQFLDQQLAVMFGEGGIRKNELCGGGCPS